MRKWIYGSLLALIYFTFGVELPHLKSKIKEVHSTSIVTFVMPKTGLKWAVLSDESGTLNFKKSWQEKYKVQQWYLDGKAKMQMIHWVDGDQVQSFDAKGNLVEWCPINARVKSKEP